MKARKIYMQKRLVQITTVILLLTIGLAPAFAWTGDDEIMERPIHLYANASFSPIGVANSFGRMYINGHHAQGERYIWGGEIVQAPERMNLSIAFEGIGQVILKEGTSARFSKVQTRFDDNYCGGLLIATIIKGHAVIKLQDEAGAYVEVGSAIFTASRGSNFRLRTTTGDPLLEILSGEVKTEIKVVQRKLNINPLDDANRPLGNGAILQVRLRSTRDVQWQVTDEQGKPVPDIPIIVTLTATNFGSVGSGVATFTATTGANGIATVPFSGTLAGTTPVTGQITGTSFSWSGQVSWVKPPLSPIVKTSIIAGAALGATLGIIIPGDPNSPPPNLNDGRVTIRP
jgi:hypothetical protein